MIGPRILKSIKDSLDRLLDRYLSEIDQAYTSSEAGLKITLSVKIGESDRAGFEAIEVGISFTQKKVKDSISGYVSEAQDPLIKAVENLRPKNGSSISSGTISSGDKSVTLEQPR